MARVLVEGSSTAYGLWGGEDGGWADRLKTALIADSSRQREFATVVNLASPLRTVEDIERSLPENAQSYAGKSPARVGVFMVGMSESREVNGEYALPPERFRSALGRISCISHDFGYAPIFVGMTPIDEERTSRLRTRYSEASRKLYDSIARESADEHEGRYVDLSAELSEQFPDTSTILDEDGLHVNSVGHAAIHAIVAPIVKGELKRLKHENPRPTASTP
ncbi:MAG TPA: GDSL-type esterase/lipase family protein [Patescibacteria group bacterium]|nr:GDSL-type esterase/lipase family protein [Patescibacteria group bacterium]